MSNTKATGDITQNIMKKKKTKMKKIEQQQQEEEEEQSIHNDNKSAPASNIPVNAKNKLITLGQTANTSIIQIHDQLQMMLEFT